MKSFETSAPIKYEWSGGYSSGTLRPSDIATKLFKGEIPGAMLCCYMLRRFGWPNEGSDDHKNLMSWTLTTLIPGFYLSVTPYLGARGGSNDDWKKEFSCSNLHFGVRFTKEVGRKIEFDLGREQFWKRQEREILVWWKRVGSKKFAFGRALKDDPTEKLVHDYGLTDDGKQVWGFYERKASHGNKFNITIKELHSGMMVWWVNDFRVKKLNESVPKMTKRERKVIGNPFRRRCEQAIKVTMLDLLRPTNVRDLSFSIFGDIEREPEAMKRYKNQKAAGYFEGAGNAPSYYYSKEGIADRAKEKRKR